MGKDSARDGNWNKTVFQQQPDAVLNQVNPVANTLYTVLDTTKNVKIESITVSVTWTVQPNPLQIIITKDGQTETFSFTDPATATNYTLTQSVASAAAAASAQVLATTLSATVLLHQPIEGRSIKVQARTGAATAGTTSNLSARAKYGKIP